MFYVSQYVMSTPKMVTLKEEEEETKFLSLNQQRFVRAPAPIISTISPSPPLFPEAQCALAAKNSTALLPLSFFIFCLHWCTITTNLSLNIISGGQCWVEKKQSVEHRGKKNSLTA